MCVCVIYETWRSNTRDFFLTSRNLPIFPAAEHALTPLGLLDDRGVCIRDSGTTESQTRHILIASPMLWAVTHGWVTAKFDVDM